MDSIGHSLSQIQEAGYLDAPPPVPPPRKLYVNLHTFEEQRVFDSLQCAESDQQSSTSLQPSTDNLQRSYIASYSVLKKTNGPLVYESQVQFTYEEYDNENGFLRIYCIGSEGRLARLEVFDSKESASKGETPLYLKPFSGVDSVDPIEIQGKQCTSITFQDGNKFIFLAPDNLQLLRYCKQLHKHPQQQIEQYNASKYNILGQSDRTLSPENPVAHNQENFGRPRTPAMSSAQAEAYKIMRCKSEKSLINQISLHDQNSSAITNVCNKGAYNHSEKPPLHPPKIIEQCITTPIPVSSYIENLQDLPMMRSNEVSTEEFTECTSTGWQPHLQDESSNAPVNSESLLHSSINFATYTKK